MQDTIVVIGYTVSRSRANARHNTNVFQRDHTLFIFTA